MPAISPRTQAFEAQGVQGDQAKTLFDQGLSQMAYNVLVNKLPNVSPDVVTFKVLDSDPEAGSGVGAFVILRRGQTIYVPVVMADNQVKPLDILYYKDLNVFLPLTKEWLEELDKMSLGEMGHGVKPPETLSTDVDIRNTVVPPTTGRYSYASDTSEKVAKVIREAYAVFDSAKHQEEPKLAFLSFLDKAPNFVKQAMAKIFETRPKLLKQAVWFYGEKPVVDALRLKQADYGAKLSRSGALYVADDKTSPSEFRDIFGPKAPLAFQGVRLHGYYARDDRPAVKRALGVQKFLQLQEPKDSGAYKLYDRDGKPVVALIIGNPINIFTDGNEGKRIPARNLRVIKHDRGSADPEQGHGQRYRVPGRAIVRDDTFIQRYVGITEDGNLIEATQLVGQPVAMSQLEGSAVFQKTVGEGTAAGPRKGQNGIFVQRRGSIFLGTTPLRIESITTIEGVKRIEVSGGWGRKTLVIDPSAPYTKLMVPVGSHIVYLPQDYVWLPAKDKVLSTGDFLSNPKDILHWTLNGLHQAGGSEAIVKKLAHHGYFCEQAGVYDEAFVPALRKIASKLEIHVDDAAHALKQADETGWFRFWALDNKQYEKVAGYLKVAEGEKKDPPPPDQGGDPAQQAMDGVMSAPVGPQMPQPVDMAVAEAMQNLTMQRSGLEQQMQLLQTIQQRTNQIAGGGGAMGSPAAAAAAMGGPMDPSQMGAGGPVMQAGPGGQPPMGGMPDPSQMGQQMPPQGPSMPPQGPSMPGQPTAIQPGQAVMGGMQPGMDPSQQQQQPPGATMTADDGSVESLMNQVNPQFMEQAGNLNDAGAFDAASLASMAQSPSLKDLVGSYLPNLEKSLDNVGRVLLTLWMDESSIKEDIGNETYISLEDNLRQVFKGMGDLILKINQNTLVLKGPNDAMYQE